MTLKSEWERMEPSTNVLHHTTVAVKVLRSKDSQNIKEFKQELEILSKIWHPHLLLLIGACIDQGCLLYEYMENGSLDDRLHRRNNGPPIPWFERYRIAWEVASALVFLHSSKPKPIIHRDLKPANILLDHNIVSKIGDVGLSTVISSDSGSTSTEPVGTLCYIDPEYQRTGLVSPKCDVYAFGIVILQLLTAKPAMALSYAVETAILDGRLAEVLDSDAGNWPIEETKELALLGYYHRLEQAPILALAFLLFFGSVELLYFSASLTKFREGAWLPIMVALFLMTIMFVWHYDS